MKLNFKKTAVVAALALTFVVSGGLSGVAPARADWYDGHGYHHGRVPYGWRYNRRLGYYIYQPAYVAVPPTVVYAPPPPPPVVVAQPQVVYEQPAPVYAQPAVGLNVGVHIR